jgi:uncharacterized protein YdaU (DUF1376 family)
LNYYPFHVGDYAAHTAHLEPMEDLAYRRLLDQYYLREGALPADIQATAKLIRMRSCAADVESVLNEFFVLTDEGWMHNRCDSEIERMQDKQAKARASAQASVNARKARSLNVRSTTASESSNERSTDAKESQADVELPTPTPTPVTKGGEKRLRAGPPSIPGVDEKLIDDWQAVRKAKRSGPLTDTAIDGLLREADRAGITPTEAITACCAYGWQGFRAEWYAERKGKTQAVATGETAYQRSMRERFEEATGKRSTEARVIDITPGVQRISS